MTIPEKTMRFEEALSEPCGSSVYGFEERCMAIILAWMKELELHNAAGVVEIDPPANVLTGESLKVRVPIFRPGGRSLILIEPHCDDVALSFLGTILRWRRPITVVTLFNRSRTVADEL